MAINISVPQKLIKYGVKINILITSVNEIIYSYIKLVRSKKVPFVPIMYVPILYQLCTVVL